MPRALPTARVKMRRLALVDEIVHWQMEDTSGVEIFDTGGDNLDSTSALDIVDGPFIGETDNKGRAFAATSSASGPSSADQRAALLADDITVEAWLKTNALSGTQCVVGHGSALADGTEANNYLAALQLSSTGQPMAFWEKAGGANVQPQGDAGAVVVDVVQHVAFRRRTSATAGKVDVHFFVDGVAAGEALAQDPPISGTAGAWTMGALAGGAGQAFDGTVYEVRIAGVALSDEAIRDSYARGVRDWDLARVIASQNYAVHTRVLIHDGDSAWVDTTDLYDANFLDGSDDSDGVDDDGATGKVMLRRRNQHLSIAPFMATSRPNAANPEGQLLELSRRIKIEEAVLPHGAARALALANMELAFDGFIAGIESAGEVITVDVVDKMKALQVAWVQPDRSPTPPLPPLDFVYGSAFPGTLLETELQAIINDSAPVAGYLGGVDTTIYVPTSPAVNLVGPWTEPPTKSVAQALTDLIDTKIGWLLRYRWDDARQEFRLTLYEPGRTRTWSSTDPTITPSQVLRFKRLELNDADIRNYIEVEYGDVVDVDHVGTITRKTVFAEDTASIAKWGFRYARIGIESASQLDDVTQAQALADLVLSDLSNPLADFEVDLQPRRDIHTGDQVKFTADDVRFSSDQTVAVVDTANARGRDKRTTTLRCRAAKPVGRIARWFEVITAVGTIGGKGWSPPLTPSAPTLTAIAGGLLVAWPFPTNHGNRRYRETEIHVSVSSGFTPSAATVAKIVRGKNAEAIELLGSTPYFVKIVHRDEMNNVSTASAQSTATPRFTPKSPYVHAVRITTDQAIGSSSPDDVIFNSETGDPFGNYDAATGVWTQMKAGVVFVEAGVKWDSDAKPGAPGNLDLLVNGAVVRTGATVNTSGGAAPNTALLTLPLTMVHLAAADTMKVRISHSSNAGAVVKIDAATYLTISTGPHA